MYNPRSNQHLHTDTALGSLLSEIQKIWDETGEPESERDKILSELEQKCLELYREEVNQAKRRRAQLQQAVADSEAELAKICAALEERSSYARQSSRSLKDELEAIRPKLEEMQKRKRERKNQFAVVVDQIQYISKVLCIPAQDNTQMIVIDENDLSVKKLENMQNYLLALEKEKSERLEQVLDHLTTINSLCMALGVDFKQAIAEIDPTLDDSSASKNISKDMINKLSASIHRLKDLKKERLLKLQDLATTLIELWNLMDTPLEEQQNFHDFTRHIAASENDMFEANVLSVDCLLRAEAEVLRLQEMKSTKMKEVLLRKKVDLEEICRKAHLIIETHNSIDFSVEAIESGAIDPTYLLEKIEIQISKVKEEAFSRRDILEKIEKWLAACDEECWLEEYNRDENRYHGGRGTHRNLKRAEKARALVNKIPAMVETLRLKARAWQKERGGEFFYDGVSLLSMLEQFCILKEERELERQRQRDQKKLQGQLMVEQEARYGSLPSPLKSAKKNSRPSMAGSLSNKRLSFGGSMLQTPYTGKSAASSHPLKQFSSLKQPTSRYSLHTGRRDSFLVPKKQQPCKASNPRKALLSPPPRTESTQPRKPLSPLSSLSYSNTNTINIQNQSLKETPSLNKTPVMTPTKITFAFEESVTPKTMPTTPPSISTAMLTAMTPATPHVSGYVNGIEYSFEEIRAGYDPFSPIKVKY